MTRQQALEQLQELCKKYDAEAWSVADVISQDGSSCRVMIFEKTCESFEGETFEDALIAAEEWLESQPTSEKERLLMERKRIDDELEALRND